MLKLTLGSLLAALAIMVFGAVFWMSPFPYRYAAKSPLTETALGAALKPLLPATGTYLLPGYTSDLAAAAGLAQQGPIVTIHYRAEGADTMSPEVFARGFLHGWVVMALLALVLRLAAHPSYWGRVLIVGVAGMAGAIYMRLGDGVWMFQPWPWLWVTTVYDTLTFFLAGLVLAAFTKPAAPEQP